MQEIYDLIIAGAGPAGICAAIYASRARLKTLWLEKKFAAGGQIADTGEVDNYPGMPGIGGMELGEAMAAHAEKQGLQPLRETIRSIENEGDVKVIHTKKNTYRTRTLILACGALHKKLEVPGEEELGGMGVSYCAACDGVFFKEKTVVVAGGGNAAAEDAVYLSRICRKVYLVHRRHELRADRVIQESLFACGNVEMVWDSTVESIEGTEKVEGVRLRHVLSGEERFLPADGVFIAVGITPGTDFLKGYVDLDEGGYVIAGEEGITSVPGVFAAGDIRTKALRQVVTAVADGANAVHSAEQYLQKLSDFV